MKKTQSKVAPAKVKVTKAAKPTKPAAAKAVAVKSPAPAAKVTVKRSATGLKVTAAKKPAAKRARAVVAEPIEIEASAAARNSEVKPSEVSAQATPAAAETAPLPVPTPAAPASQVVTMQAFVPSPQRPDTRPPVVQNAPRIIAPGPPPPTLTWPPPKPESWPANMGPPPAARPAPEVAQVAPPVPQRPPMQGRGPGFNQQQRPIQPPSNHQTNSGQTHSGQTHSGQSSGQSSTGRYIPPAPVSQPPSSQPPAQPANPVQGPANPAPAPQAPNLEGLPAWAIPKGPAAASPPAGFVPPPPRVYQQGPSAPVQRAPQQQAPWQQAPAQQGQQGSGQGGGGSFPNTQRPHAWNNQRQDRGPATPPRKKFEDLTTIDPQPRLTLEYPGCPDSCRLIDLFCPIGRGQRALIVSPPKAGKTTLLKDISAAIARNNPELELIALLVDERPEEVTDFRRHFATLGPKAQVIASSNDHGVEKHIQVSMQTMTDCKRAVEEGRHVVVVLDSLTRLGRAFNLSRKHASSGRTMSGGLDARALEVPRQIFGAARNTEDGGSLTIIATCLVDTGSRGDEVIFEEFKGSGNMELILDRKIAERRLYPSINLAESGTRKEHLLMTAAEAKTMTALRRQLLAMPPHLQIERLIQALRRFQTNSIMVGAVGGQPAE